MAQTKWDPAPPNDKPNSLLEILTIVPLIKNYCSFKVILGGEKWNFILFSQFVSSLEGVHMSSCSVF